MANRFQSPNEEFVDSTGLPYAGGSLSFFASGTSTPLNTYSDSALSIANANPVVLDSAGRAGDIFLQNLAYKVVLKDSGGNTIWTKDPVYTSDYSAFGQFKINAGNPNGSVAGTAGSGSIPSSVLWDSTNNILYVCTTTGSTSTAVWTAVNSSTSVISMPTPQGYLTMTSGTPVITADVVAGTSVFYALDKGNLVPIYNGSSMVPTAFTELTLTLSASHTANSIYDVFVFSNVGVVTLATGPSWSTATAGSGARGAGAGTTELTRLSGILVNAQQMTARNGATTYTVPANQGTYVGSIWMDGTNGQITCHRSYGQTRKWGVWNAYNQNIILLQAGDSTASWTYTTNTVRASNAASANKASVFQGLSTGNIVAEFIQHLFAQGDATRDVTMNIGIGLNSTTAFASGNCVGVLRNSANGSPQYSLEATVTSALQGTYGIGINDIQCLEKTPVYSGTAQSATYFGSSVSMILSLWYRG